MPEDGAKDRVEFRQALDLPWTSMPPLRLGKVPAGLGTADRFVVLEADGVPTLRIDLHRAEGPGLFEDVRLWAGFVALGWEDRVDLIEWKSRRVATVHLGSAFGSLIPSGERLLVASFERLFCFAPDASLSWKSVELAIDGVTVERVEDGVVHGQGEWDPPGGWRPFSVDLSTGRVL